MAGKTAHECFQTLLDNPQLRRTTRCVANAKTYIKGDFAAGWRKALHDGMGRRNGVHAEDRGRLQGLTRTGTLLPTDGIANDGSRFRSGPIRRSTTAAMRTWAGCRSCPSR